MKFGFIGAGNMVSAIAKGMTLGTQSYAGNDLYIASKSHTSAQVLAEVCGAHACGSLAAVVGEADVLILGVKPHILEQILPSLEQAIAKKKPIVVSLAAGKDLAYLQSLLPEHTKVVRAMPNINAKIGASITGLCPNAFVSADELAVVTALFETIGSTMLLEETQYATFSALGGAAVAFAYMYIDALARAGLKAGMPKKQALEVAAQGVLGSARMVLESDELPWGLVDQVCSPGGTTIEGVASLQGNAFESTVMQAVDAVIAKDALIGKR